MDLSVLQSNDPAGLIAEQKQKAASKGNIVSMDQCDHIPRSLSLFLSFSNPNLSARNQKFCTQ